MRSNIFSKIFAVLAVLVLASGIVFADSTDASAFRAPTIYKGAVATKAYWTAGTINNGGDTLAVAAGSADLTTNKNDCAAPTFTSCNFVYADNTGAVAVTTTLATAVASGNTLLAMIETGAADAIFTNVVLPQQSGTLWNQAAGPITSAVTAFLPAAAGGTDIGSAAKPFGSAFIGAAATNNFEVTGTATGARTVTLPDASFTVGQKTVTWAQGGVPANAVNSQFFIADEGYVVTAINVVWGTAETTGDMDIMLERLQGTEACGSGDDLQAAVVDATGAANTVATPALTATPALLSLAAGDRLCVDLTATPNEVANIVVTVTMNPE